MRCVAKNLRLGAEESRIDPNPKFMSTNSIDTSPTAPNQTLRFNDFGTAPVCEKKGFYSVEAQWPKPYTLRIDGMTTSSSTETQSGLSTMSREEGMQGLQFSPRTMQCHGRKPLQGL